MWECGLKHARGVQGDENAESLLMWECGLKQWATNKEFYILKSLLMWECGLKQRTKEGLARRKVTPYVGVWIETIV